MEEWSKSHQSSSKFGPVVWKVNKTGERQVNKTGSNDIDIEYYPSALVIISLSSPMFT